MTENSVRYPRLPVERLVRAFAPEQIILFGSYAKNTARPGSDVDLLIVAEVAEDREAQLQRARQLVRNTFPRVDIVLCTPEELAEALVGRSPFLASVVERGVTIYQTAGQRATR